MSDIKTHLIEAHSIEELERKTSTAAYLHPDYIVTDIKTSAVNTLDGKLFIATVTYSKI